MKLEFFEPCSRIDVKRLCENRPMTNIAQILLFGEGYVTRAMRNAGANEKTIWGNASDFEKFRELCRVYPLFEGNVAQYVCREILKLIFEIDEELSEDRCQDIWEKSADVLIKNPITPVELISRLDVSNMGILTHITSDLSDFERLGIDASPVLCPDTVFSVDRRGYKKRFAELEKVFGDHIPSISAFEEALGALIEKFVKANCTFSVLHGVSREDLGKSDYFHAEGALTKAIASDGNISSDEAGAFRRYAIGKFLEICRKKKVDVLLEFSAPTLEIMPDIRVESPVERRIWLNFSDGKSPLAKEGVIDLCADPQAQFSAYAKRFAIGNLPPFFVGTSNPAELCLHKYYRDQLEKYLKSYEK